MQRINFEDTTITKQPYIEIEGQEYEVHDGTYQGGTDLDAETFNTLQDNIEEALANVGGNEIAISETEPTTETTKLWINSGELGSQASEITNSYSESTGIGYSANYVNNLFQPVQLWSGTKYSANDTLTLSENLQAGHLYAVICQGVSSIATVTLPFIYIGGTTIQIAYANVAGSTPEGFRYRLTVSGTTLTIDSNSQGNNANSAILRVYKIM